MGNYIWENCIIGEKQSGEAGQQNRQNNGKKLERNIIQYNAQCVVLLCFFRSGLYVQCVHVCEVSVSLTLQRGREWKRGTYPANVRWSFGARIDSGPVSMFCRPSLWIKSTFRLFNDARLPWKQSPGLQGRGGEREKRKKKGAAEGLGEGQRFTVCARVRGRKMFFKRLRMVSCARKSVIHQPNDDRAFLLGAIGGRIDQKTCQWVCSCHQCAAYV